MLEYNSAVFAYITDFINAMEKHYSSKCIMKGSLARAVKYPADADVECNEGQRKDILRRRGEIKQEHWKCETNVKSQKNNSNMSSWQHKKGGSININFFDWDYNTQTIDEFVKDIYSTIIDNIVQLQSSKDAQFVRLVCGYDDRFDIKTRSLQNIKPLLSDDSLHEINRIESEYSDEKVRKFFIDEVIHDLHSIKFSVDEIIANKKTLPGGLEVSLTDMLKKNTIFKIKYSLDVPQLTPLSRKPQGSYLYPFGIDFVVVYPNPTVPQSPNQFPSDYYYYLANYKKEYYYLLFIMRRYFNNIFKNKNCYYLFSNINEIKDMWRKINTIIDEDYGAHNQLIEEIKHVNKLVSYDKINEERLEEIYSQIVNDIRSILPPLERNRFTKFVNDNTPKPPSRNMQSINAFLKMIQDYLESYINNKSKIIFFEYLKFIPKEDHSLIYIADAHK